MITNCHTSLFWFDGEWEDSWTHKDGKLLINLPVKSIDDIDSLSMLTPCLKLLRIVRSRFRWEKAGFLIRTEPHRYNRQRQYHYF